ncbi:hypothetical protein B0H13DRAFT_1870694 [Mycena leptocephala]|nr:hypothetical protein B0H13DRAFT_1870694 [Mycena leptocephala]
MSDLDWQNNGRLEFEVNLDGKGTWLCKMDPLSHKNIGVNASPVEEAKDQKDCRIDTRTSGDIAEVETWLSTNEVWATKTRQWHWFDVNGKAWATRSSKIVQDCNGIRRSQEKLFRCHEWWIRQENKYGGRTETVKVWICRRMPIGSKMEPREQDPQTDRRGTEASGGTEKLRGDGTREQDPRTDRRGNKASGGTEKLQGSGTKRARDQRTDQRGKKASGGMEKNCKAMEPREQEIDGQIDAGTKPVEERKSCEAMKPTEQEPRTGRRGNKDGGGTEML